GVAEQIMNAVVPIVPCGSSWGVAGDAEWHLPPQQRPTHPRAYRLGPVEVLPEVRRGLVRLVPIPRSIRSLTGGIHVRFKAPSIPIQRFDNDDVRVSGSDAREKSDDVVHGPSPGRSVESDQHFRRSVVCQPQEASTHSGEIVRKVTTIRREGRDMSRDAAWV